MWQRDKKGCITILLHANIQARKAAFVKNFFSTFNNFCLNDSPLSLSCSEISDQINTDILFRRVNYLYLATFTSSLSRHKVTTLYYTCYNVLRNLFCSTLMSWLLTMNMLHVFPLPFLLELMGKSCFWSPLQNALLLLTSSYQQYQTWYIVTSGPAITATLLQNKQTQTLEKVS